MHNSFKLVLIQKLGNSSLCAKLSTKRLYRQFEIILLWFYADFLDKQSQDMKTE